MVSDYFGALLRAAGALAAPAGPRTPSAAAAPRDDIVEQQVDVEAAAPSEPEPTPAEPAHEPLDEPAPAPMAAAQADGSTKHPGQAPQQAALTTAPAAAPAAPSAAPWPRHEQAALAHPVVRAALRWVAAEAQSLPAQASAALPTETNAPAHAAPSPQAGPAAAPAQPVAQLASEGRAATASGRPMAVRGSGEIDLSLPAAPRPWLRHEVVAEGTAARPAAAPGIDLHIGTIHVAVDAPPRVVLQPAAPPAPRPQPPQAERGGWSRMRLPRL